MKIAVVGCGAVGIFYGARLALAGHSVHFLLRSDYDAVRQHGVELRGQWGSLRVRPSPAARPEEIGPADLVVVALKTTANDQFGALLTPLVGPETMILTLQNGLGNEERLAEGFGADRVLGGLCFVCLNRVAPGVVQHLAHGQVTLGEFKKPTLARTRTLARLFQEAGIPTDLTDDLEQAHWEKLVWNIPFNGLGVGSAAGYDAVNSGQPGEELISGPCLTTDLLLADPRWEQLVRLLMAEVIGTANALGLPLSRGLAEENIARTRVMGAYKPSTLIDFEQGRRLEMEGMFLRPLACARKAGMPTPRLAALCRVLSLLDRNLK